MSSTNDNPVVAASHSPQCVHQNYLEYLKLAWGNHLGVVIDPKFFWYMILTEVAIIIKNDPERYRALFSESEEKTMITVLTSDPHVLPVAEVIKQLMVLVLYAMMMVITTIIVVILFIGWWWWILFKDYQWGFIGKYGGRYERNASKVLQCLLPISMGVAGYIIVLILQYLEQKHTIYYLFF